ncbi:hypothetical protein ES288_A01G115300v1 [Gossypium darwinii]|uniref:Uncharacterized protein n=1 Tax=Gossypium darwinii TaxID=34276 RepID=A0A5D2HK70_GOSDA|nr:hypothetical protein ES288_A01G115300v1 [Gossypium darwinii]
MTPPNATLVGSTASGVGGDLRWWRNVIGFGEVNGKDLAILVQGGQASDGRRAAEGVVQCIRV